MLGLPGDSYEAYCLDEAVIYFGLTLEHMLDEAGNKGNKPSKEETQAKMAREKLINQVLGVEKKDAGSGYADPALMFL